MLAPSAVHWGLSPLCSFCYVVSCPKCLQSISSFTLVGCGNVFQALSLVNTQFSVMASLMLSCHSATDAANTPKVTCCAGSADRLCMDRTTYCHHRCLGTALLTPVHFSTQIKLFNLTLNEPQNIPGLACNLEEIYNQV